MVLVVLVVVLVVLGVVFSVLVAAVACHYFYYHKSHPQDQQNHYQDHSPYSLLAPPTIIEGSRVEGFTGFTEPPQKDFPFSGPCKQS